MSTPAFFAYVIAVPLFMLGSVYVLLKKRETHIKLFSDLNFMWVLGPLMLLLIAGAYQYNLLWLVFPYFWVFTLMLLITLWVFKRSPKNKALRVVQWVIYIPTVLFLSFLLVYFQPGEGLDFDGAMESGDACRRALNAVMNAGEANGAIEHKDWELENLIGRDIERWTVGSDEVVCRANHYLRRVMVFKVNGVSKLHFIEKSEREFRRF